MDMKTVKAINIPYDQPVYKILDYIHFNGAEAISFSEMLNYRITNYEIEFKVDDNISSYVSPIGVKWDGGGQYYPDNEPTNYVYVQMTPGNNGNYYTGRFMAGNTNVSGQNYSIVKTSDLLTTAPKFDFVWNELVSGNTYRYGYRNFATTTSVREGGLGRMQTRTAADFQGFYIGSCLVINYNGSTFTRTHTYDFKGNIYSFKYNDGVSVYNMVPAQRVSDNVCGLYDLDSGEFRAMVGTTITDGAAGNVIRYITTPISASVKKIENSNGDIIWGSYDEFPYRRLEYIHFSGAEYLFLNDIFAKGHTYAICGSFGNNTVLSGNARMDLLGSYDGNMTNTSRRFYICSGEVQTGPSTIGGCFGNTWYDAISFDQNIHSYFISLQSNDKTALLYLWNGDYFKGDATAAYNNTFTNSTTYSGYTTPLTIGNHRSQNGTLDSARWLTGNIYWYTYHVGGGLTDPVKRLIPCQRKSDNVCGLYDVINQLFYPMQGTNITSAAAGPVLDEYWNLTAPS